MFPLVDLPYDIMFDYGITAMSQVTMTAAEVVTEASGVLTDTNIMPIVFAGAIAAVLGLIIRAVKKAAR
jgi:hypothetical protein